MGVTKPVRLAAPASGPSISEWGFGRRGLGDGAMAAAIPRSC